MIRIKPYRASDVDTILSWWFVIVNPHRRGKGYGKAMLQLGLKFVFEIYGAKKVSLGVFENNLPAYYCYKAVGFKDVVLDTTETYCVLGEEFFLVRIKLLYLSAARCHPSSSTNLLSERRFIVSGFPQRGHIGSSSVGIRILFCWSIIWRIIASFSKVSWQHGSLHLNRP